MKGYLSFLISALCPTRKGHAMRAPLPRHPTMPIYEYRCTQCGHKLEALQKLSEAPLTLCPSCGKEALTKLVSAAGFQLKGSGWYQTDFRGGSKPAASADTGKESAKTDTASSTGTESGTASSSADKPAAAATPSTPSSSSSSSS